MDEQELHIRRLFAAGPKSSTWEIQQAGVILLIKGSLGRIRNRLVDRGWNPDTYGLYKVTAKQHYEFIMDAVPKMAMPDRDQNGNLVSGEGHCIRVDPAFDEMSRTLQTIHHSQCA